MAQFWMRIHVVKDGIGRRGGRPCAFLALIDLLPGCQQMELEFSATAGRHFECLCGGRKHGYVERLSSQCGRQQTRQEQKSSWHLVIQFSRSVFTALARYPHLMAGFAEFRILLVEDSDADQILTPALLRPIRCVIDVASNGQLGVEQFRARHYNLVLMDFEMPVMDGFDAIRAIRKFEAEADAARTPVLGLTSHTIATVAAKAYEAGFTALLSKPIRRQMLLESVASYGGQYREAEAPSNECVEDLDELIPAYLEKRRMDVIACHVALQAEDFAAIRRLGHNMKGTGAGYGFPGLTELGGQLEAAALRSDRAALRAHLERLADYIK